MGIVTSEELRKAIDDLISQYDGRSNLVSFGNVIKSFSGLDNAYGVVDAIFGSGDVAPTATTPMYSIADFASQYLDSHNLDAVAKAQDSVIANELYNFYLQKFPTALYGLFSAVEEVGRKYGGYDPDANQLSDEIIIPSFVNVQTANTTDSPMPSTVSGSFAQPAVNFKNTLSNTSTSDSVVGWINHYFTVDSSLSAGSLYTGSPSLDKTTAFIVFGALDRNGNVGGLKYANAKNTYSKPVYYGETGLKVGETTTESHILNNSMSMYIGQSTYGYVGIDVTEPVPKKTGTTTTVDGTLDLDVDLLGYMFSIAPTIQNNKY